MTNTITLSPEAVAFARDYAAAAPARQKLIRTLLGLEDERAAGLAARFAQRLIERDKGGKADVDENH